MREMNYQQLWMELRSKAKGSLLEQMNRMEEEEYRRVNFIPKKTLNTDVWDAVKKATK